MTNLPIRVLLVDDHTLVRAGIKALLATMSGFVVVGEAADGLAAVDMTNQLRPDVILMDISMLELNGLAATEKILRGPAPPRIMILSMHTAPEYVDWARHIGAAGYVVKDACVSELETALQTVARGETYVSPAVIGRPASSAGADAPTAIHATLTARQSELLRLVGHGASNREIAATLHISIKTVETHMSQLHERLHVKDRAGLIHLAVLRNMANQDPKNQGNP